MADVFWDTANQRIVVEAIEIAGGFIEIDGGILSTGAGAIRPLGQYGRVTINNSTALDVVVSEVNVSKRGTGILTINDTLKPSATRYSQYVQDASGNVTVAVGSDDQNIGTPTSFTNGGDYNPIADYRYGWSKLEVDLTQQRKTEGSSSWLGIDAFAKDPATLTFDPEVFRIEGPTLSGDGPYFFQGGSSDPSYSYSRVDQTLSERVYTEREWTESTWYGKKTRYATFVKETKTQYTHTHSINADRPIEIDFIGYATPQITINSTGSGDVTLLGDLLNSSGTTNITSGGAITTEDPTTSIQGTSITLQAADSIGLNTLPLMLTQQGATGAIRAISTSGNINLEAASGSLRIDEVNAQSGGKVTITAPDSILVATGTSGAGTVAGGKLNLTATTGSIGDSTSTPLKLESGQTNNDTVTLSAAQNIFVQEQTGDLRLVSANAANGDVFIDVVSGDLIDAETTVEQDERTYNELVGVWASLGLTNTLDGSLTVTTVANFDAATNTIVRTDGQDWTNVSAGDYFDITGTTSNNTGANPVQVLSVSGDTITLKSDFSLVDELGVSGTFISLSGTAEQKILVAKDAIQRQREQEYETYWRYRNGQDPDYTEAINNQNNDQVSGIVSGQSYFAHVDSTTGIQLAANSADAIAGTNLLDLASSSSEGAQHRLLAATVGASSDITVDFDGTANSIVRTDASNWTGIAVGDYLKIDGASVNNTNGNGYIRVLSVSGDTITIDGDYALQSETGIEISFAAVTVTASLTFDSVNGVADGTDIVSFAAAHGLVDGAELIYERVERLAPFTTFHVIPDPGGDPNKLALATSAADATAGDSAALFVQDFDNVEHRFYLDATNYIVYDNVTDGVLTDDLLDFGAAHGLTAGATLEYRPFIAFDNTHTVTLSADQEAAVRAVLAAEGLTTPEIDAAVAAQEEKQTLEYQDLHSRYGGVGDFFDDTYEYTLTQEEIDGIEGGIKVWTEDELLNLLSAGLLKPVVDTTATIEVANIDAGGAITITSSGDVGSAGAPVTIDLTGGATSFTDDERVALASAERNDIAFLRQDLETVTVNFNAGTNEIVRSDGSSWTGIVVGDSLLVSGQSDNATENSNFLIVTAVSGDTLTIDVAATLEQENQITVDVAPVVLDPLAVDTDPLSVVTTEVYFDQSSNTIVRNDGGAWATLSVGDTISVTGSSSNNTDDGNYYTIADITGDTITLEGFAAVLDEGDDTAGVNATLASVTPVTITTIFVDQRDDVDVTVPGTLQVTAGETAFIGSETDILLLGLTTGGDARVKTGGEITGSGTGVHANTGNLILEASGGTIGASAAAPLNIDLKVINTVQSTLTARADGTIWITETSGDLAVETLYSQTGDIVLTTTSGSIIDGLNHEFEKLRGNSIVLTAVGGGIGEVGDRLEFTTNTIDGLLTATAAGDVRLEQVSGNFNVDRITATGGDVELVALLSILDRSTVDPGVTGRPAIDIFANSVDLTATVGTIGEVGNDLDIDSSWQSTGDVTTSSGANTHLIEVVGDLNLYSAGVGSNATAFIAANQAILNAAPVGTSNVTGGRVQLFAGGNIGASAKRLFTTVGFLEGLSTGGAVWITNEGDLTIGGIGGLAAGLQADGDINLQSNSPTTVSLDIISDTGDILIEAIDDADADDDVTVQSGITVNAKAGSVNIEAGDDILIETGALVTAAVDVNMTGDVNDADAEGGIRIDIAGTVTAGNDVSLSGAGESDTVLITGTVNATGTTTVSGGGDDDTLQVNQGVFTGDVAFAGGAGDDTLHLIELQSHSGSFTLDGGEGSDTYIIETTNLDTDGLTSTDYEVDVSDSGSATDIDTLTIEGRGQAGHTGSDFNDIFLIRANFVASLDGDLASGTFSNAVERINYDESINGGVRINSWAGDDGFISDDTSTIFTLDGGTGKDTFQIGQVFGSDPSDPANLSGGVYTNSGVALGDEIEGTAITRGFLSNGISAPMVIYGGEDGDTFTVFSNKGFLRMEGEDGNDNFIVRAFVATDQIQLNSGAGDDIVEYNINAPLSINGGSGFDTVTVIGTEEADSFVVTSAGVFGAGLNISVDGVEEAIEVDGLEGDDTFYLLSSRNDVVTTLIGGLGGDNFVIAGDVINSIVSADAGASSGLVTHGLQSNDDAYDDLITGGIAFALKGGANDDNAFVLAGTDSLQVVEDDSSSVASYLLSLAIPEGDVPAGTVVTVTIAAALSSSQDRALATRLDNDEAETVQIGTTPTGPFSNALTLTFVADSSGSWTTTHTIYVQGTPDDALEGLRKAQIAHSAVVTSSNPADDEVVLIDEFTFANVEVEVIDDDLGGLIIEQTDGGSLVLEGPVGEGIEDTFTVQLTSAPTDPVTVTLSADAEIGLSDTILTFTSGDWDSPQTVTITAVDDAVLENNEFVDITYTVASADTVFDGITVDETTVQVVDNDTPGVLLVESGGSTELVSPNPSNPTGTSDTYTLRLTKAPTDDVTLGVFADAGTNVTIGGRVFLDTVVTNSAQLDVSVVGGKNVFTRTGGGSWLDDGLLAGDLIQVKGNGGATAIDTSGTDTYKIQDVTATELTLTSTTSLAAAAGFDVTITQVQPSITFTGGAAGNWDTDVTVELSADPDFETSSVNKFLKSFAPGSRTAASAQGPVVIEGGTGDKDRSLSLAVMLPTETPEPPLDVAVVVDETIQTDTLTIYNDASQADDTVSVIEGSISGLGMGVTDIVVPGENGAPDVTIPAGINHGGLEVVQLLMGDGNDTINVDTTRTIVSDTFTFDYDGTLDSNTITRTTGSFYTDGYRSGDAIILEDDGTNGGYYLIESISTDGLVLTVKGDGNLTDTTLAADIILQSPITVLHGGGNRELSPGVMGGDDFVITGSGTGNVPLILLGDTTQDGSLYNAASGATSELAARFDNAGNDTVDGSGTANGFIFYGGEGVDNALGGSGDDQFFGGSAGDTLNGNGGNDHLYGDSGLNIDVTRRYTLASGIDPVLEVVNDATISVPTSTGDGLTADADTLLGGTGDDISIGDFGTIDQLRTDLPEDLRLLNTGNVTLVQTVQIDQGGADIFGDPGATSGNDVILGGFGGDDIGVTQSMGGGDDVVIGDNGSVTFVSGILTNATTSDTTNATGGDDQINFTSDGSKFVLGGIGTDTIDAFGGNHVVMGDNGTLIFDATTGNLTEARTSDTNLGATDAITVGQGNIVAFGGAGSDTITTSTGTNTVFGDFGVAQFTPTGLVTSAVSTDLGEGAGDILIGGNGDNVMIGGFGADQITSGSGGDVIVGDNVDATFTAGVLTILDSTDTTSATGDGDTIIAGGGDNRIIGGVGGDNITSLDGDDVIAGDNAVFNFNSSSGLIESAVTTNPGLGGIDIVSSGAGNDIVLLGFGADQAQAGAGDDTVIGDNGVVTFNNGVRQVASSSDTTDATGGGDTVDLGTGDDQAIMGVGDDTVTNTSGETIIIGDDGSITSDSTGRFLVAKTDDLTPFGNDNLSGGSDRDIILGGPGSDDGFGNDGSDIVLGDSGQVTREPTQLIIETTDLFNGGSDFISGGDGNDFLLGGADDDVLDGTLADDALIGNYGRIILDTTGPTEKAISVVSLSQGDSGFIRETLFSLGDGEDGFGDGRQVYESSALPFDEFGSAVDGDSDVIGGGLPSDVFGGVDLQSERMKDRMRRFGWDRFFGGNGGALPDDRNSPSTPTPGATVEGSGGETASVNADLEFHSAELEAGFHLFQREAKRAELNVAPWPEDLANTHSAAPADTVSEGGRAGSNADALKAGLGWMALAKAMFGAKPKGEATARNGRRPSR